MREPKSNPPYVSVPKMEQLFNLLSTRNFQEITMQDLLSRGFAISDANQALQGLRFLGLIDESGKTNENTRIISMKGEGKNEKIQQMIKSSYSKLFETVPSAETLTKAELHDEFMAVYNISSRIATTAVPAFLWLCKYAGMNVSENIEARARVRNKEKIISPKTKIRPPHSSTQSVSHSEHLNELHDFSFGNSGIMLLIPKSPKVNDLIAEGKLIEVRNKINEFAELAGLDKKEQVETESSEG